MYILYLSVVSPCPNCITSLWCTPVSLVTLLPVMLLPNLDIYSEILTVRISLKISDAMHITYMYTCMYDTN